MTVEQDEQPVVADDIFMENIRDALSDGYDLACAHCGVGTAGDDMDIHERQCPEYDAVTALR
jgi:hypothetical protein